MDVTCERCSTAYEFDDALVSERGTTVKCTNCGHQFRIRRPDASGQPERWVVRTVDGRELEFKALRELQSAIAQTHITREDVLSRGATRPRRLGSIAELDPFFVNAALSAISPGAGTVLGVGPRPRVPTPQGLGVMQPRFEGSVAIPLPTAPPRDAPVISSMRDDAAVTIPRGIPLPLAPAAELPIFIEDPPTDDIRDAQPPPPPAALAATVASERRSSRPPPPARIRGTEKTVPVPIFDPDVTPPAKPGVRSATAPATEDDLRFTANYGTPRDSALSGGGGDRASIPDHGESSIPSDSRFSDVLHRGAISTPTPSNVRNTFTNEEYIEPRFSSLAPPPRRSSAARWIIGFVLSGVIVLGGVTLFRRFLVAPAAEGAGPSSDQRVTKLLTDGEKALAEGDLEGAQENFDKASALAEKDPRVAVAEARIAVTRGDVAWLKTKLLASDDPDLPAVKKTLAADAERTKRAVARAAELAPADVVVTRARIDAARQAGDVEGARKLVAQIASTASQPETGLTLAALDLGEEKVDMATVIRRLREVAQGNPNAGRARSMLVYALAKSGDGAAAKAELDHLAAAAHPHPLTPLLRAYVAKAIGSTVDLAALPEVGKQPIPADWHEALKAGDAAKGKGDKLRAETLYAAAVDKSKGDPEALSGFADFKWETGDKPGAKALYKQVVDKAKHSSPFYKHAKERGEAKGGRRDADEGHPRDTGRYVDPPAAPTPLPPPPPNGAIDTSDLPGVKAPTPAPAATAPAPAPAPHPDPPASAPAPKPAAPPGVDTSDLPGFK